jgi:Domain of unknown function (DUF3291)
VITRHLAQVNISRLLAPLDSPLLADFVARLDEVNATADEAPGFVWRLKTEDNNATAIRVFDDTELIVNMSVWDSVEALADFVFRDRGHLGVLRRRRTWFAAPAEATTALWWVPAGHVPTVSEAEDRLIHLRRHGPTPFAFTFRDPFPAPGTGEPARAQDDWFCPAR